jgi:hypothetical protein
MRLVSSISRSARIDVQRERPGAGAFLHLGHRAAPRS